MCGAAREHRPALRSAAVKPAEITRLHEDSIGDCCALRPAPTHRSWTHDTKRRNKPVTIIRVRGRGVANWALVEAVQVELSVDLSVEGASHLETVWNVVNNESYSLTRAAARPSGGARGTSAAQLGRPRTDAR